MIQTQKIICLKLSHWGVYMWNPHRSSSVQCVHKNCFYVIKTFNYFGCRFGFVFFFFSKALSTSYWANCCLQHEKIQLVNVSTAQIRVLRDERKYCECRTASTLPTVSFSLVSLVYKCGWLASHLITMWEVSQFKVRLASLFSLWRFFLPYQSFLCFYFLFLETKCYSSLFQTNFSISHSAVHFLPRGLEDGWNNLKIKSNIKLNFCCWFLNWIKKKHPWFTQFYLKGFCSECRDAYE